MTFFRHRVTGPGSAGDVWVTTMHSQSAGTIAAAHDAWRAIWANFWADTFGALVTPQTKITEQVTDRLDAFTGKNVEQRISNDAYTGTGTGATVSPRSCMVLSFTSSLPNRAGRGRMFLPSPDSDHYATTGEFAADTAAAVSAGWASAVFAQMSGTITPQIYHRSTFTGTQITGVKVGTIPGTQRRRTNKSLNAYSANPIG